MEKMSDDNAKGLSEGSTGVIDDANKAMRAVVRGWTCYYMYRLGLGKALESTKYVLEPVEMELYHSYNMDGDVYIFMLGMVFIFTL